MDKESSERMEYMNQSMKQQHGITEQLKAEDQMKWVGQIPTFGFVLKSQL